jgi:hypothetical protein
VSQRMPSAPAFARAAEPEAPRHEQGNVSFDRPRGWANATVVTFVARDGPPSPTIMMWREPLERGDTLQAHTHRTLVRFSKHVPGFELVASEPAVVGGRPASLLRFRFTNDEETVDQTLVLVDPDGDPDACVTVFSTAARQDRAEMARAAFFEVLASVRFGGRAGSSPPRVGSDRPPPHPFDAHPTVPMPGVRAR